MSRVIFLKRSLWRPTLVAFLLTAPLVGCGKAPEAVFVTSRKTNDVLKISLPAGTDEKPSEKPAGDKGATAPVSNPVEKFLTENFGTPNRLIVWEKYPIDFGKASADKKPGWKLKDGRDLYMTHCLHCHGVSGDGNGPTAQFLNPRPRDYRLGVFKFTSTKSGLRISRDDLKRVLHEGIPGTSMPSFVLLGEPALDAIVEYVRFLAQRGESELRLTAEVSVVSATETAIRAALDRSMREQAEARELIAKGNKAEGEEKLKAASAVTRAALVERAEKEVREGYGEWVDLVSTDVTESWTRADLPASVVVPGKSRSGFNGSTGDTAKESLVAGRELYFSKKAKCVDCHGASGRGDGPATTQFWEIPKSQPPTKYERLGLHDDWGNPQQPRNLTRGVFRGGRRPVDLYRRIYAGIKGTQMPAFGGTALTDDEIWHIVNYVMALPHLTEEELNDIDAERAKQAKAQASHTTSATPEAHEPKGSEVRGGERSKS